MGNRAAVFNRILWFLRRRAYLPIDIERIFSGYCLECGADAWWTDEDFKKWLQREHNKTCPGTWVVTTGYDRSTPPA